MQFIAYGTLRPGHGNSALWTGYEGASSQPVTIPNVKLLGRGVPFARVEHGAVSIGDLVTVPEEYDFQCLTRLDRLEGHPHNYVRVPWPCVTADGETVVAWMYLDSDLHPWAHPWADEPVPNNDWGAMTLARRLEVSHAGSHAG